MPMSTTFECISRRFEYLRGRYSRWVHIWNWKICEQITAIQHLALPKNSSIFFFLQAKLKWNWFSTTMIKPREYQFLFKKKRRKKTKMNSKSENETIVYFEWREKKTRNVGKNSESNGCLYKFYIAFVARVCVCVD